MNDKVLALIANFKSDQSLSNLQPLQNIGISVKEMRNNNWSIIHEYELPFSLVFPLYDKVDGVMTITGVGIVR